MLHNRWFKLSLVILVLAYWVFALKMYAYKSDELVCQKIDVTVSDSHLMKFVKPSDVVDLLKESSMNIEGNRMDRIDTDSIENYLKKQSRIKTAECYISPDGCLRVKVTQREPILRVMSAFGNYYIDYELKKMAVSSLLRLCTCGDRICQRRHGEGSVGRVCALPPQQFLLE